MMNDIAANCGPFNILFKFGATTTPIKATILLEYNRVRIEIPQNRPLNILFTAIVKKLRDKKERRIVLIDKERDYVFDFLNESDFNTFLGSFSKKSKAFQRSSSATETNQQVHTKHNQKESSSKNPVERHSERDPKELERERERNISLRRERIHQLLLSQSTIKERYINEVEKNKKTEEDFWAENETENSYSIIANSFTPFFTFEKGKDNLTVNEFSLKIFFSFFPQLYPYYQRYKESNNENHFWRCFALSKIGKLLFKENYDGESIEKFETLDKELNTQFEQCYSSLISPENEKFSISIIGNKTVDEIIRHSGQKKRKREPKYEISFEEKGRYIIPRKKEVLQNDNIEKQTVQPEEKEVENSRDIISKVDEIKLTEIKRDMTSWHAAYCNSLTEKQYFPVCDLFSAFGSFSSASKKIRNDPEVISVAKDQKEILRKGNFILKSLWSLIPANTNERRRKLRDVLNENDLFINNVFSYDSVIFKTLKEGFVRVKEVIGDIE